MTPLSHKKLKAVYEIFHPNHRTNSMSGTKLLVLELLCLWLITVPLSSGIAADSCLNYEPAHVQLFGKILKKQAFGPPGYGDDPAHDRRETYLVLLLRAPICVNGDPASKENIEKETDVREIQLVYLHGNSFRDAFLNHYVSVTGTLFHAITGHHRTKVLMEVMQTKLISGTGADKAAR